MAKENNAPLIFDFDNTITEEHMHSYFRNKWKYDLNSTTETAVTDADIRNFLKNTDGIKK
ncbi:hypothetical protein HET73_03965 [Wolbachia endosymbiont of Atemnus politus]|uniref:hypothetical protein n=1 Tax=Wolbachia endosymbiont of Atemnus politus TaxID=2682840 RepID=UPI00157186A8|nr:hypothetical protein [Wolbachia endosymbiont of Atemnus politus]NSM56612.1 hypothetical protein [Wolbachia endosymbiont of Atemnus politus]